MLWFVSKQDQEKAPGYLPPLVPYGNDSFQAPGGDGFFSVSRIKGDEKEIYGKPED